MAVEIVGEAGEIKRRATCNNCGAILEYLPKDIKHRTYKDISQVLDVIHWIECPRCSNEEIYVKG